MIKQRYDRKKPDVLGLIICTFPKIHLSLRVTISTKEDEVQIANTKRSAMDKFKRNKLVELRKTFDVKMTIMTKRFPKIPTKRIMEQRTKLVQAMYSGSSAVSNPRASVELFMILWRSFENWDAATVLSKEASFPPCCYHRSWGRSKSNYDCGVKYKILYYRWECLRYFCSTEVQAYVRMTKFWPFTILSINYRITDRSKF